MKNLIIAVLSFISSIAYSQSITCYNEAKAVENGIAKPMTTFQTCFKVHSDRIVQSTNKLTIVYKRVETPLYKVNRINERYTIYGVIDERGTYCKILAFDDAMIILYEEFKVEYTWNSNQ